MRENMGLYRGKRKDNGEWVEGNLFENDNAHFPMVLIGHVIMSRDKHTNALSFDGFDLCEVDPETVGQFTGLPDKNGMNIFKGDIVEYFPGGLFLIPQTGIVEFHDGAFGVMLFEKKGIFLTFAADYCKVIGNIHDNPELLEVK